LWAEKKGASVYLCSSDKDLTQLINDRILMLQLHKNNLIIDAKKVEELYGVRPDQIVDLLAIMGDASDNIPGLEGFGPKTAATLLQEFGTLDKILAHPERVKGEKKQHVLRTQQKEAWMSKELATLNTHVKIPKDTHYYLIKEANREKLADFFQEMKFTSLLKEMAAPSKSKAALPFDRKQDYRLVDTEKELENLLQELSHAESIGIDTETTSLVPLLAHLVGIGFAIEPSIAWYLPLNGSISKEKVLQKLKHFFSHTSASFFGHNLKYDYHILQNLGIEIKNIDFDTLLASYLINPQNRKHNLDDLCLEKFQYAKIPLESLIGKGKNEISMREVPIPLVKDYCCEDIDFTTRLKQLFEKELQENKLDSLLHEIELPLLPILAGMERVGIYLDVEELRKIGSKLVQELHQVKEIIFKMAKEEFNLNSPKQLSEVLYKKLGLKAGSTSTSAEILEELANKHPIAQHILNYRTLEKLRSTYIEALPHAINPVTDRIHCTFHQSVAATGRLSCQNPNLQNIPVHSEIRSCFKAKRGWSFLGADYSQIELRLLAHFSEDENLIHVFQEGGDIHAYTASLIFSVPENDVTEEMRRVAKTVNFGILYGLSAFGLSKQLNIPYKEAAEFIAKYFERYPRVLDYLEDSKEKARKLGYSQTLTGRRRPIPEMHNKNPSIRNAAERLAINTPLQGTAADLIKLAMIHIDREIRQKKLEGRMILQIHDELIFEIPEPEIVAFQTLVKNHMENVISLKVPIEVSLAVGKNWAEC
ncbi:MAG: hypothetical protein ACD_17C00017G0001, partial [uncultured bacterium]